MTAVHCTAAMPFPLGYTKVDVALTLKELVEFLRTCDAGDRRTRGEWIADAVGVESLADCILPIWAQVLLAPDRHAAVLVGPLELLAEALPMQAQRHDLPEDPAQP